MELVTNKKDL